jgi:hypothetical protein
LSFDPDASPEQKLQTARGNLGAGGGGKPPPPLATTAKAAAKAARKVGSAGTPGHAGKKFDKPVKEAAKRESRDANGGNLTCAECGRNDLIDPPQAQGGVAKPPNQAEVDHVIEREKGGNNTLDNAEVLCVDCHKEKTNNR